MKQSRPRESSRRTNQFRSPRTLLTFAFAALLLGCLSIANLYSRQVGAQDLRARFQQDLGQVFSAHEEISLEPRTTAQQVRASGRISLVTPAHDFELQLQPNDLRAPNYRAEEVGPDGITREVAMPAPSTYKGNLQDVWGSDARFTVHENEVEGMIVSSGDSYFLEPAQKYSRVAQSSDYVLYKSSDVRPDIVRTCATTLEERSEERRVGKGSRGGCA